MQAEFGISQIKRTLSSYPIPPFMKSVEKGQLLSVTDIQNVRALQNAIDRFLKMIPIPKPLEIDPLIISSIGDLPLMKLHDPLIQKKIKGVYTLDVSYNPALSIKDIMARQMVTDAIKKGYVIPGKTIVAEATSGNTGAGLALMGSLYGTPTILVIPSKVSGEKIERLRGLGAHVIVAPVNVMPSDPYSYYSVRDYLGTKMDVWVPQQYDNLSNTKAHYLHTGPHIWNKTQGKVTAVIIPTGTSGTVTGIGRYLKERNRNIKVIGVDTVGSILYLLKEGYSLEEVQQYAHSYDIQGFGEDIFPKNLDLSVIDKYIRISDMTGLTMTRILPALGIFQGQSSGASYAALLEALDTNYLTAKDVVVVMFPDLSIPYRMDVFNDTWMQEKKFPIIY